MMRLIEIALAGLVGLSAGSAGPATASTDDTARDRPKPPGAPTGTAAFVQSVVDTVLDHHIDPPARQQMILNGIQALYKAAGTELPERLSSRVSAVTTPEQLARLLDDIWPASTARPQTAEELEQALCDGLLSSVSGAPHLVPEKERKVQEQSEGNRYVGIHIALGLDEKEKRPSIAQVIEGGPADRAGVKSNDLIEQIEGVDTKGMALRDAIDRLRGDEGTSVTIKVRQPGTSETRIYNILRGTHPRPTITGWRKQSTGDWDFQISDSGPIAYVRINEMAGSTPRELRKLALELERQGLKAIIFDLRGRWTSSAHTALLLADSLLDHGTIGRVRTAQGETVYHADADAIFRGWPIAVLVDGNTSGAAEWLAAAIQDNHRGIVVGSPTLSASVNPGYAVVTSYVHVPKSDSSISLATGILERADGRPVSAFGRSMPTAIREPENKKSGVHPDHLVPETRLGPAAMNPYRSTAEKPVPDRDSAVSVAVVELRQMLNKS